MQHDNSMQSVSLCNSEFQQPGFGLKWYNIPHIKRFPFIMLMCHQLQLLIAPAPQATPPLYTAAD